LDMLVMLCARNRYTRYWLFRISAPSSSYIAETALAALKVREDWTGHFSVIEDRRVRIKPLPIADR
jgi:hypothetical protein